ncbi:MAG: hypothetical protein KDG50_15230 [Chromatiales bacterium]|nr:hypothetical protein [Chromatiales bacterium]
MDEQQYRRTYRELNRQRCVFEKGILARQLDCEFAERFCLAEREGVGCQSAAGLRQCEQALELLAENARFALGMLAAPSALPHARLMKLQVGGLRGIQAATYAEDPEPKVDNIFGLLTAARTRFTGLDGIPFDAVMPFVAGFKGRQHKRRERD